MSRAIGILLISMLLVYAVIRKIDLFTSILFICIAIGVCMIMLYKPKNGNKKELLLKAKAGDANALLLLGEVACEIADFNQARDYFEKAADKGSKVAQDYLKFVPYIFSHNRSLGVQWSISFGEQKWFVLDVVDGKALLLREYALDKPMPYHEKEMKGLVYWRDSTVRQFLNVSFYNEFAEKDRERIVKDSISNKENPWFSVGATRNTKDHIFLLSIREVLKYFGNTGRLKKKPKNLWDPVTGEGIKGIDDAYNNLRIARPDDKQDAAGVNWWLRSTGNKGSTAAYVDLCGELDLFGEEVMKMDHYYVRPALWVRIK